MKKTVLLFIFILVFAGAVYLADFALYPCTYMRNDVHSVTTDAHDVLFLGTSNGKMNLDPDTVLADTVLSGHNLCNGNQFPVDSFHLLQLAIETNRPAVVVLDVDPAVFVTDKGRGNNYLLFFHEFPLSRAKVSYFFDAVADCDLRSLLFPFYEYPLSTELARVRETVYRKANQDYDVSYLKGQTGEYHENGWMERYPVEASAFPAMSARAFAKEDLRTEHVAYLEKMIALCEANNITFIAASLPQADETLAAFPEAFENAWNYFEAFFSVYGVPYYNFNREYHDAVPHDLSRYVDYNGHMNGESARDFSNVFGEIVFADMRGE